MAGILLSRKKVADFLKSLGHKQTGETIDLKTGRYRFWETPWGYKFPVPDGDHQCPTWRLAELVAEVDKTRPTNH